MYVHGGGKAWQGIPSHEALKPLHHYSLRLASYLNCTMLFDRSPKKSRCIPAYRPADTDADMRTFPFCERDALAPALAPR